jgi:hypothetical protein
VQDSRLPGRVAGRLVSGERPIELVQRLGGAIREEAADRQGVVGHRPAEGLLAR